MSVFTICGFCNERVPFDVNGSTLEHSCEIVKSLKRKFDEALLGNKHEMDYKLDSLDQELHRLKAHNGALTVTHNAHHDNISKRLDKVEKEWDMLLRPQINVRETMLLSSVGALNKIVKEELDSVGSPHPSRQHLEKKLEEKNKQNKEHQYEITKLRERNDILGDCLDRKQREISALDDLVRKQSAHIQYLQEHKKCEKICCLSNRVPMPRYSPPKTKL